MRLDSGSPSRGGPFFWALADGHDEPPLSFPLQLSKCDKESVAIGSFHERLESSAAPREAGEAR